MDCKKVFQERIKEESTAIKYNPEYTNITNQTKKKHVENSVSKIRYTTNNKKSEHDLKIIEENIIKSKENKASIIEKIFSFMGIKS